jgi:hypothetical protein
MDNTSNNTDKVTKAISSLDGIQRATPGPFFFTRVQARLQNETAKGWWAIIVYHISKPAVALSTLSLIIIMNVAALYFHNKNNSSAFTNEQTEQTYSDDFNTTLALNSYYDENTETR